MTNDTLIAVPAGSKQISQIKKGEEVLTASAHMTNGKLELVWEALKVDFSSGSGASSHHPLMVYVELGTSFEQSKLICVMDQSLLLANGKFTTASKLRLGQSLVDKEGNGVPVNMVNMGGYLGGVHAIATMGPWNDNPDGHLLLAGGVVVGDFQMQMFFDQLPDSMKEAS